MGNSPYNQPVFINGIENFVWKFGNICFVYLFCFFQKLPTRMQADRTLSMTGYTFDEFNALLPAFEQAVFECDRTLEGKERENKPTVYKNSPFPSFDFLDLFECCFFESIPQPFRLRVIPQNCVVKFPGGHLMDMNFHL